MERANETCREISRETMRNREKGMEIWRETDLKRAREIWTELRRYRVRNRDTRGERQTDREGETEREREMVSGENL